MRYRFASNQMRRIFEELYMNGSVRISNPNKRLVGALRLLERRLKEKGYDFDVIYDPYKRELIVFSYNIYKVGSSYVYFSKF